MAARVGDGGGTGSARRLRSFLRHERGGLGRGSARLLALQMRILLGVFAFSHG